MRKHEENHTKNIIVKLLKTSEKEKILKAGGLKTKDKMRTVQ